MKKWGMFAMFALVASAACSSTDNNDNNGNNGGHDNHENHDNHDDKDTGNGGGEDSGNGGGEDSGNGGGEDSGNGGGEDSGNGGEDSGNGGEDTSEPPTGDWTLTTHTCAGNRTDTLFCEDDQTCYVGCGTVTTGAQGYFVTTDGGATWAKPTTTPAGYFDTARVNSISKHGDTLYVAGELPNSMMVVSVSPSGEIGEVLERGSQFWASFPVGSFRRTNDKLLAESQTGTSLLYREDGDTEWSDGTVFYADGDADDIPGGVQIMDLEVYDGEIWGVGSLINQPPTVFTPKWTAGDFDFGIVQLAASGIGAYNGEQYGIDIDASGVVIGGVNQTRAHGNIFTLAAGDDPNEVSNWKPFDVGTLFDGQTTWVQDVCRFGETIYAVGRESSEGWGFVLKSEDNGATFADITPYDTEGESELEDMYRCQAFADGVIAAGAGGQFIRNF